MSLRVLSLLLLLIRMMQFFFGGGLNGLVTLVNKTHVQDEGTKYNCGKSLWQRNSLNYVKDYQNTPQNVCFPPKEQTSLLWKSLYFNIHE